MTVRQPVRPRFRRRGRAVVVHRAEVRPIVRKGVHVAVIILVDVGASVQLLTDLHATQASLPVKEILPVSGGRGAVTAAQRAEAAALQALRAVPVARAAVADVVRLIGDRGVHVSDLLQ